MVFLGGIVHEIAEQAASSFCRQGGVLQAAGCEFHPGYGPAPASVSPQLLKTTSHMESRLKFETTVAESGIKGVYEIECLQRLT